METELNRIREENKIREDMSNQKELEGRKEQQISAISLLSLCISVNRVQPVRKKLEASINSNK